MRALNSSGPGRPLAKWACSSKVVLRPQLPVLARSSNNGANVQVVELEPLQRTKGAAAQQTVQQVPLPAASASQEGTQADFPTRKPFRINYRKYQGIWQVLCNNLLFLMGIILVNYGVEEGLNYYLDDWGALGSFACILVGGGILLYIRINKVPVAQSIMRGFWGG